LPSPHLLKPTPALTPPRPATPHTPPPTTRSYPARPSKSALREQLFGDTLYGVAPVLAALKAQRRSAHVLYVQDSVDMKKRKDARLFQVGGGQLLWGGLGGGGFYMLLALSLLSFSGCQSSKLKAQKLKITQTHAPKTPTPTQNHNQECLDLAKAAGVAVRYSAKHDMNMLSNNRPHQGLLLDCSDLQWVPLDRLPPAGGAAPGVVGARRSDGPGEWQVTCWVCAWGVCYMLVWGGCDAGCVGVEACGAGSSKPFI